MATSNVTGNGFELKLDMSQLSDLARWSEIDKYGNRHLSLTANGKATYATIDKASGLSVSVSLRFPASAPKVVETVSQPVASTPATQDIASMIATAVAAAMKQFAPQISAPQAMATPSSMFKKAGRPVLDRDANGKCIHPIKANGSAVHTLPSQLASVVKVS